MHSKSSAIFDVVMLSVADNCNTGWRFCKCLRTLGLNVIYFKGEVHPFLYPEQAIVHPAIVKKIEEDPAVCGWYDIKDSRLKQVTDNATVIHFRDSCVLFTGTDLSTKKVVVQHGGRSYRVFSEQINTLMNPFADSTLIQMPDLLGLGAKNEHLIYFPVDTGFIQPTFGSLSQGQLLVAHFPTYQIEKGSEIISEVFEIVSKRAPGRMALYGPKEKNAAKSYFMYWTDHLERMACADIVIDVIAPTVHGKPYGEWGNTTFEAAALGKLVITNSHRVDIYRKEYGTDPAVFIANDAKQLEDVFNRILGMSDKEIRMEREKTRSWVEQYHGIVPTAARLWERIYRKFFE